MDGIVFKVFGEVFRVIGVLIITGVFGAVLMNIQKAAFHSKHVGLVSLVSINEQLTGRPRK